MVSVTRGIIRIIHSNNGKEDISYGKLNVKVKSIIRCLFSCDNLLLCLEDCLSYIIKIGVVGYVLK